jgi:hypothetical protein
LGFSEVCPPPLNLAPVKDVSPQKVAPEKSALTNSRSSNCAVPLGKSTREIEVFASKLCPYRFSKIVFLVLAEKMKHTVLGSLMLVGW